ncbi:MAG: ferrous iron transport protein B [Bacillota bacterium]|nr:ferrous iron transport protein B [Bacillota bacterium]
MKTLALVGNPNVGKSVLFYHLTGNYVTVSNYPGTTVEISRGMANVYGKSYTVYDTPGMYSLSPVTEEEAVTRRLLMEKPPDLIVHVVDAKNLPRMLPLTLELQSLGLPIILVLNMMDEAEKLRVHINRPALAARLGIPVLEAAFGDGRGVHALKREIMQQTQGRPAQTPCNRAPAVVQKTAACLEGRYPIPRQVVARLFLEDDSEIIRMVHKEERSEVVQRCLQMQRNTAGERCQFDFALGIRQEAQQILAGLFRAGSDAGKGWLDRFTLNPLGGLLVTVLVLYIGLYLIVGRFGAGTLVDLLEGILFGEIIIPEISGWVNTYLPWFVLRELLAGEFGILTLGFRYAFGIILPIVGTFFFVFAVLEDTGYLPRLAYWLDSLMGKIGLNGRAVIPLTLGLGCGTMAVLVTRTLESRRERVIATFLLALAVPCSAQLGLIMALLSKEPVYLLIWVCMVSGIFLFAGQVLHVFLPGIRAPFFMELPPLRMPKLNAILQKTLARMHWYFLEIIPVFIVVSVSLFILREVGLLNRMAEWLTPLLGGMGLPPQLSLVFLYGFFRRDYGAAGLFDLYRAGQISGEQLLVVLTLFLPCLAQLAIMVRERGILVSAAIAASVFMLAFAAGFLLRFALGLPPM